MKKKIAMLLAGVMLAGLLAGCGSDGKETETNKPDDGASQEEQGTEANADEEQNTEGEVSGEITIWTWTDIGTYIEAYESAHPGTKINQVVIDAGDYVTKIQTTLASGGDLPDALWGEILNRGILFEMDILDDLSGEPYNLDTSLVEESMLPTMKNEAGQVVGLERNLNPTGLAYHRNLALEYFGTDDPAELEAMFPTWEAFIEAGKEVKEKSDGKVTMFTSLGDVYYLVNGQAENPRIAGGTISEAETLALFTKICEFRDAGIVSQIEQWTPAWYASFSGQDSVFSPMPSYGTDNWIVPNEEDGESDWGLMVPPEGGFNWGGTCWGITKDSQNKELAWDFVCWDTFEEGVQMRYEAQEIPSAKGFMDAEKVSAENPYYSGQKIMEVYINEILPTIHINPVTAYDYTDICTVEVILSSLNADYSMTAQEAVDLYMQEMKNQIPEIKVD